MGLNKVKGNMYKNWITHTWNPLSGECKHNCDYCYVKQLKKRFPELNRKYSGEIRIDYKQLNTNLGKNNFIFVCSCNDLFQSSNKEKYVLDILEHIKKYPNNKYLLQTKKPNNALIYNIPEYCILGTTIETDYFYFKRDSFIIQNRALGMSKIISNKKIVTIEPIMDFNLYELINIIKLCNPYQVNIGANTSNIKFAEPSKEKTLKLIKELKKFTNVVIKDNLKRIIN